MKKSAVVTKNINNILSAMSSNNFTLELDIEGNDVEGMHRSIYKRLYRKQIWDVGLTKLGNSLFAYRRK